MKLTKTIAITISDADKSKCDWYCEFYNYCNILTSCTLYKDSDGDDQPIAFNTRCRQCITEFGMGTGE